MVPAGSKNSVRFPSSVASAAAIAVLAEGGEGMLTPRQFITTAVISFVPPAAPGLAEAVAAAPAPRLGFLGAADGAFVFPSGGQGTSTLTPGKTAPLAFMGINFSTHTPTLVLSSSSWWL